MQLVNDISIKGYAQVCNVSHHVQRDFLIYTFRTIVNTYQNLNHVVFA